MKVYIGYDEREHRAAEVAVKSLRHVAPGLEPELLCAVKLVDHGLLTRVSDRRGQYYDLVSNETHSTDFKFSRFLTPMLCQSGFALFVDCDVVFREDPRVMLQEITAEHAVSVVKHQFIPVVPRTKMVGQMNPVYPRKNWSSVMLFNCDHPANRRLSLRDVNERRAVDLHNFYWLADDEIGELRPHWNWLVGEQAPWCEGGIAHFTLGGPWLPGWRHAEHDDIWLEAAK